MLINRQHSVTKSVGVTRLNHHQKPRARTRQRLTIPEVPIRSARNRRSHVCGSFILNLIREVTHEPQHHALCDARLNTSRDRLELRSCWVRSGSRWTETCSASVSDHRWVPAVLVLVCVRRMRTNRKRRGKILYKEGGGPSLRERTWQSRYCWLLAHVQVFTFLVIADLCLIMVDCALRGESDWKIFMLRGAFCCASSHSLSLLIAEGRKMKVFAWSRWVWCLYLTTWFFIVNRWIKKIIAKITHFSCNSTWSSH